MLLLCARKSTAANPSGQMDKASNTGKYWLCVGLSVCIAWDWIHVGANTYTPMFADLTCSMSQSRFGRYDRNITSLSISNNWRYYSIQLYFIFQRGLHEGKKWLMDSNIFCVFLSLLFQIFTISAHKMIRGVSPFAITHSLHSLHIMFFAQKHLHTKY